MMPAPIPHLTEVEKRKQQRAAEEKEVGLHKTRGFSLVLNSSRRPWDSLGA